MSEPYLTPFWQHLGYSPVQLGLVNAISPGIAALAPFLWGTIGYILAAVAAGVAVDRIGLRAGMYGMGLAMLACGVVAWMGRSRRRTSLPPALLGDFREGNAVSGFLYEPLGMAWLYAAAAALASVATVLYWAGTRPRLSAARVAVGHLPEGSPR